MRLLAIPSRFHLGLASLIVAALAVSQLIAFGLGRAPDSLLYWELYFEYGRRFDAVYRFASFVTHDLDAGPYIALLGLFLGLGELAHRYRVKVIETLFFHAALMAIAVVVIDNFSAALGDQRVVGGGPAGPGLILVLCLAVACGGPLALACLRQHYLYICDAGGEIAAALHAGLRSAGARSRWPTSGEKIRGAQPAPPG